MIDATNASLNQILHDISRQTGMKITGGVSDERVFGHYGPAPPAAVLDALLDGTSSNMLLIQHTDGGTELVLTPQNGGPTPPNPNAGRDESGLERDSSARREISPRIPGQPRFGVRTEPRPDAPPSPTVSNEAPGEPTPAEPTQAAAAPAEEPQTAVPESTPAAEPATTGAPQTQSPNGVATPQQIYQQLQQLQQQQKQNATPPPQ